MSLSKHSVSIAVHAKVVPLFDLVADVEAIFHLPKMLAAAESDAQETAIILYCLSDITNISVKKYSFC